MYITGITHAYVLGLRFSSQHQSVIQCESQMEHEILLVSFIFTNKLLTHPLYSLQYVHTIHQKML